MPRGRSKRSSPSRARKLSRLLPKKDGAPNAVKKARPALARIPSATYRLQLNRNFRFRDAIQILDYLRDLGISHVYVSPILGSRRASEHGYDATDPTRIDPELGTEDDFLAFEQELRNRGMGLVLDIVPNHMAASSENPWWMDVLENGPGSAFALYFDIDWHPPARNLDGKILLPVLGRPFGEVLDSGELRLQFESGRFQIRYFESSFPLAPKSYPRVLSYRSEALLEALAEGSPEYQEYSGILAALSGLFGAGFGSGASSPKSPAENRTEFEAIRGRLRQLVTTSSAVQEFIESNIGELNGKPGDSASFNLLEALLAEQYYKLAYWQNVNESINYRRFFTISDLVGMRVEDPAVFEATHGLILRIASRHPSIGLRIDHIDGLRDPEGYLQKLHDRLLESESSSERADTYVIAEKILSPREQLPESWPVHGTTGYDYLNHANGIFTCKDNGDAIERIYRRFIGKDATFGDVVVEKKKLVMNSLLGVEVRALGRQLAELAASDRYARDLPRVDLTTALIETTAYVTVYRTYVRNLAVPDEARRIIEQAIDAARESKPFISAECFDFVRDVLLLLAPPHVLPEQREARLAFLMRWQQFTGPIVAKGVEDTALYVYHPLLSLNEVGGDAQLDRVDSSEEFFNFLETRQAHWPCSLNASTTHDTKRSEDVRARLNVLSEIPEEWESLLLAWSRLNAAHKSKVNGQVVPDGNEEYYIYQTLLGTYPAGGKACDSLLQRLKDHIVKATREAMVHTRWTSPNLDHENGLTRFLEAIFSPRDYAEFLDSFLKFHAVVAFFGMVNSLSQCLLKITCPGVPDFYQGSELWDLRLVDPDNRQAVNFECRADSLKKLQEDCAKPADLLNNWKDGRVKEWLIREALRFRCRHDSLFREGELVPLRATGRLANCVVSFLRRHEGESALVVVPRWLAQAGAEAGHIPSPDFWGDTQIELPESRPLSLKNVFTGARITASNSERGRSVRVGKLFEDFPVALLHLERSGARAA